MALSVFIVEDEKAAAESLVELLTAQGGIEIVGTANSEVAVADWLLHSSGPGDLLITDLLLLPGGSGFGIICHAKSLSAFRRVAVFSNYITPAIAQKCRDLGADAVFPKTELADLLEYVCSLRE